ncbi:MAG: DMT family transporter [Gammaproteobacteria bacterium]|nr:MAG: DMT family transporter [Gammaproteobacteria bacterium]
MNLFTTHFGEILSLLTAIVWSAAVVLFKKSGEKVHPIGLNFFKDVFAIALLVPTMLLTARTLMPDAPLKDWLILLASGALGIGVADTIFFQSLNILGAGRSSIVDCLYSPFIIGLSILWLGESLTTMQIVGVVMILSAVLAISGEKETDHLTRGQLLIGIVLGVLAMAAMAVGVVLAKPVLDRSELLWVTTTRLVGGVLVLLIFLLLHPERLVILRSIASPGHRRYTLAGAFLGGYLSMIIWLAGMKYTQASIAAALNQTNNIFIFIMAAMFLHERITPVRLIAIILGITGAIIVGVA